MDNHYLAAAVSLLILTSNCSTHTDDLCKYDKHLMVKKKPQTNIFILISKNEKHYIVKIKNTFIYGLYINPISYFYGKYYQTDFSLKHGCNFIDSCQ